MSISSRTLAAGLGGHVEQPAVEVERLLGVQELVQVRLFREVPDPLVLLDLRGRLANTKASPLVGNKRPSSSLMVSSCRTRSAEQAEDLALGDLQVEGVERDLFAAPRSRGRLWSGCGFRRRDPEP